VSSRTDTSLQGREGKNERPLIGIWLGPGNVMVEHRVLELARVAGGGGIYAADASAVIRNCLIAENSSSASGGGIYLNNGDGKGGRRRPDGVVQVTSLPGDREAQCSPLLHDRLPLCSTASGRHGPP